MTGGWSLPMQAVIEDRVYQIHTDYRDVLELLRWLDGSADPTLDQGERWYVAMRLFYPDFGAMPRQDWPAATRFLTAFLAAGRPEPARHTPRLMDWWSFLSWFDAIGEGTFATVVAIRDKLRRGKKLEPWELDFYRTHRAAVDLRPAPDPEAEAEKQRLLARLGA